MTVGDPAFRAQVESTASALRASELVAHAPTYYDAAAANLPIADQMVSTDRRTTVIPATLVREFDWDADTHRFEQLVAAQRADGFTVVTAGEPSVDALFNQTSESDLQKEVFGLPVTLVVFRSIVVPIKAIVMNLLSVGAAYGLMVLVFQKGYGHELLGLQRMPTIEAWVPIFLFCVLFGLSMDYHVFLLSRIREHFDATGRNRESVALGLQSAAKIITGAALIMVVVFSAFAMGGLVMFQQLGFGLAVAILLDATIVRSVLVPASMALLGSWNWYLPTWLRWLPDVRVEGAPAPAGAHQT